MPSIHYHNMKLKRRNFILVGLAAILPFKWLKSKRSKQEPDFDDWKVETVKYGIAGKIRSKLVELKRDGKGVLAINLHPDTFKEFWNEIEVTERLLVPYPETKLHPDPHPGEWETYITFDGVPVRWADFIGGDPAEICADYFFQDMVYREGLWWGRGDDIPPYCPTIDDYEESLEFYRKEAARNLT